MQKNTHCNDSAGAVIKPCIFASFAGLNTVRGIFLVVCQFLVSVIFDARQCIHELSQPNLL